MKQLGRLAGRALLALGWISLIGGVLLFALERSGVARRFLLQVVEARLGVLGGSVRVQALDFRWLEAGVELQALSVTEEGRELLRVERLHAALGFDLGRGLRLARLEIDRGRVLIGPSLSNGLRGLLDVDRARPPNGGSGGGAPPALPVVQVRGLDLALETPGRNALALGRLDLAFERAAGGAAPPVRGRITLPQPAGSTQAASVSLEGRVDANGVLELQASALDLHLEDIELPSLAALDRLRGAAPAGLLTLDGKLRRDLSGTANASGNLRLLVRDASLAPIPGAAAIEAIELDLDAAFAPNPGQDIWTPEAWNAHARFAARFLGSTLRGGARGGAVARPGHVFKLWARIPELAVTDELDRLLGAPKWLHNPWEATRADGLLDVELGLRCGEGWRQGEPLAPHLEGAARVANAGALDARWLGIPPRPGEPRVAFPLPVTIEALRVLYARSPRVQVPELLAVEVQGTQAAGPVSVAFTTWADPGVPHDATRRTDKELWVSSPRVALDAQLETALAGVETSPALREIFPSFRPADGHASVDLRLAERVDMPYAAVRVRVGLEGAGASWRELPARASDVSGTVEYRSDGRGTQEVAFALAGALPNAARFDLHGRRREDREEREARAGASDARAALGLESIELRAHGIALDGDDMLASAALVALCVGTSCALPSGVADARASLTAHVRAARGAIALLDDLMIRKLVAARWPEVGKALRRFGPAGRADLRFARVLGAPGGEVQSRLEVVPLAGTELRPPALPLVARAVQGRVLTTGAQPGESRPGPARWSTRVVPLAGIWPGGARVALHASFPAEGQSSVRVFGAGLEPMGEELGAELARLTGSDPGIAATDLARGIASLELSGALDVESELAGDAGGQHAVYLRRNDLRAPPKLELADLQGRVVFAGGALASERISARLGRTPFMLRDARFELGGEERRLVATVEARDVPLDREPLGLFLDERALSALIDEFGWRGRIDVPGWRLDWRSSGDGRSRLELAGDLTLTDVHMEIGLPMSIGSASGRIHELVVEDGAVRAYGELFDLYGELVGREVGPARVLLTMFGSRLSLDAVEGSFVRGTIRGLDQELPAAEGYVRPAPVLAIELAPPYAFQLALALEDVDVGLFLRDLFPSNIADRGRLTGELRLAGEIEDVLSIRGAGEGELRSARLWSIPVFRDLFAQLGFEDTAIFDAMKTRFSLADGVISMSEIEVRSPILKLVGEGTLDLDGTLKQDFEVRYSVVDKIGILKQVVRLVQNSLLSVSIRGDMSRPVVILRGALTALFRQVDDEIRSIPLPEYSALPERF